MLTKLFTHRTVLVLLSVLSMILAAIAINVLGIRLIGSVNGWDRWLTAHRGYFMAWRVCVYAATAYLWWWMRQRVREREPSPESHRRLLRTEITAVMVVVALEAAVLLTSPK
jgi:hypothetical protein